MKQYIIEFKPSGRRVACFEGTTILSCCHENQIEITGTCGGQGKCHSCKVRIEKGILTAPTRSELNRLSDSELERGWRLACQAKPAGDLAVYLPQGGKLKLTSAFRAELLEHVRAEGAAVRGRGPQLGVAIDLGTTRIAGYLLNLRSGELLYSGAVSNPQAVYGDDVISRITYALKSAAAAGRLRRAATDAINPLIADLCSGAGVEVRTISAMSLCGNTAMHHLALGLPVRQLAQAPYLPAVKDAVLSTAGSLGLAARGATPAYFFPNIGGYVGGDHVAALLAVNALKLRAATLVVDIGTNTEISLVKSGTITSVSCASGPAFEGGHIRHGMKAGPGAIDRVSIRAGAVKCHTIPGSGPAGICGSGILDAVACMLKEGAIDEGGRMLKGHPLVRLSDGRAEMPLAVGEETAAGIDIVITQGDIREVQLAKAAIRTGINVLLGSSGLDAADIRKVIVAGTFGSYIDIGSAVAIGMLPALPLSRFRQVGNAAGAGACRALISVSQRKMAEEIALRARYLELAESPDFMQKFVAAMNMSRQF